MMKRKLLLDPFCFIFGSSLIKRVSRRSPLLVASHRAIDGALLGVSIGAVMVSLFAWHYQNVWVASYAELDFSRELSNKLVESIDHLETYALKKNNLPNGITNTKLDNLLYLEYPSEMPDNDIELASKVSIFNRIFNLPMNYGY